MARLFWFALNGPQVNAAVRVIGDFGAYPAADLQAHVRAGHVIEPRPIEAADLHVLDRLGLYGKIGCLARGNRNQTSRGAEEEAFHHFHLTLSSSCRASQCRGANAREHASCAI